MGKKQTSGVAGQGELDLSHIAEGLRPLAVPCDSIDLDPANVRLHGEPNLKSIRGSLRAYGQRKPLVVNKRTNIVEAGNGTLLAARELGWTHVAAVFVDDDPMSATGFAIADNRTAELAEWDLEALAATLRDLVVSDADLQAMVDDMVADVLVPAETDIVEDEPPAPPAVPVTRPGDLWLLGEHRLLCGDSTKAEAVERLLGDRQPFLMATDPPYGVNYDPSFRSNNRTGVVTNDDRASWLDAYKHFPGAVAYVWHGNLHVVTVADDLIQAGFELRSYIVWKKPALVMGRSHYHWQHEPCFYAARDTAKWCGDRTQSTIWEIDHVHPTLGTRDDGETVHGCQKPVECMARPIRNHGSTDDDVFDPFLGSGTTLIAAQQLGRRCYGLEVSPAYCDVIVQRWQNLTGKQATLEATGETLEALKASRGIA